LLAESDLVIVVGKLLYELVSAVEASLLCNKFSQFDLGALDYMQYLTMSIGELDSLALGVKGAGDAYIRVWDGLLF
jgi:hypothetical protein